MDNIARQILRVSDSLEMLLCYNAWCNVRMLDALAKLPPGEAIKERPTRFRNMVHTMNHIYVIDDIFKAHLEGRSHHYTSRNTDRQPSLIELREKKLAIDEWYLERFRSWSESELDEPISFEYVGGGRGLMTRRQILLHLINHGTYHRGVIADMLYQVPIRPPVSDITVYIRDVVLARN